MKTDKDYNTIDAMIKYGGSFVKALGYLAQRADPINFEKIKKQWPHYWEEYEKAGISERMHPNTDEDDGHELLINDITALLAEARNYVFHDFKNEKYAMPKLALINKCDDIMNNTKNGKYDNKIYGKN